jgi:hypothetical protein
LALVSGKFSGERSLDAWQQQLTSSGNQGFLNAWSEVETVARAAGIPLEQLLDWQKGPELLIAPRDAAEQEGRLWDFELDELKADIAKWHKAWEQLWQEKAAWTGTSGRFWGKAWHPGAISKWSSTGLQNQM